MNAPFRYTSALNAFYSNTKLDQGLDSVRVKILSFAVQNHYLSSSPDIVFAALQCLDILDSYDFSDCDVFSGNEGEILISAILADCCFEVTVEIDGTNTVSIEVQDKQVYYAKNLSLDQVEKKLREVVLDKWISSVGFVLTTGTRASTAGRVLRFETPAKMAVPA